MGGGLSKEEKDEVKDLRRQLAQRNRQLAQFDGTYWNCMGSIWDKKEEDFEGHFVKYKDLRKNDVSNHYDDLRQLLEHHSEGIEAQLPLKPGSVYDAEVDSDSVSTVDTESGNGSARSHHNKAGASDNHTRKNLKTIRGERAAATNMSKAHLLPNDKNCNDFWLPELQMVLGRTADATSAPEEVLMKWAANMHTNKLVFGMKHQHYFDDLKYGTILAIPLYESIDDVGRWRYQDPYELLIVCDSVATYKQVGIGGNEKHVAMASPEDIKQATSLLSEATKILADSLQVNWQSYYENVGNESDESKKVVEKMKTKLETKDGEEKGKVLVPTGKLGEAEDPKLFKVKFADLFVNAEERKYIPDPLLALFKAAVNLSAYHYKTCKLLPACISVSSEESEMPEGPIDIKAVFAEIRIVRDDEDDDLSVCSGITYQEDEE